MRWLEMFQNISSEVIEEKEEYKSENKKEIIKQVVKDLFTKQNIALYITTFMASTVSLRNTNGSFWIKSICGNLQQYHSCWNGIYYGLSWDNLWIWSKRRFKFSCKFTYFYCLNFNIEARLFNS